VQHDYFGDSSLLGFTRNKLASVAASEPERNLPAEIALTGFLIGLHLPDAFADGV
jgi:hypothetical protein